MNRRELMIAGSILAAQTGLGKGAQAQNSAEPTASFPPGSPARLLLNDYLPKSIYKIPIHEVPKAKFPVFDGHYHGHGPISVSETLRIMDKVGVAKSVIFTGATNVERFKQVGAEYAGHPDRFDLWCMFDLQGVDQSGFGPNAIKVLEECHSAGAKGIGELHDKGWGIISGQNTGPRPPAQRGGQSALNGGPTFTHAPSPPNPNPPKGPHPDDPRLDQLWDKVGQLGMAVNFHTSDPIWSYLPMDASNDGLMNGWSWTIVAQPGMYGHDQLVTSLENTVKKHPKTQFIASHLCNLDYDLGRLGAMFDKYPNFNADISARFAETATIPRVMHKFLTKYPDRIVYGTDVTYNEAFFGTTFRILETDDDHFYMRGKVDTANFNFNYHWTLNGFGLPDDVLKKVYHDNMTRIMARAQSRA
jgi:uncharacterized protein